MQFTLMKLIDYFIVCGQIRGVVAQDVCADYFYPKLEIGGEGTG